MRACLLVSLLLACFALFLSSVDIKRAEAEDPPAREDSTTSKITPTIRQATERILDFLAGEIRSDGSMGRYGYSIASASLTGTAFMAQGSAPGRGKYGKELKAITDFILSNVHETSGYITNGNESMYSHGFATLFLAEVYGMTPDPRVEIALRKAVRLIEYSQGALGGWRYQPRPDQSDISVTICQVMALRAARNAGIPVDPAVIERARKCVKTCANPDGGFSYIAEGRGGSAFPRSAAGVCILYYLGDYNAPEVKKGLDYLERNRENSGRSGHTMYAYYYAAQAMFQVGGETWDNWYAYISDWIISKTNNSVSNFGSYGGGYAQAMAAIILQIPLRYLPILQR